MNNIDIRRACYSMASINDDSAEITLYGDVVESHPTDWWTGEPLPGDYICQDEFLEDLKAVSKCKNLTIRINSYGGDSAVGFVIHNRLRELAGEGVKLTCIVDGVAMSAASVIMCACDTVKINPTALVMVHRCWSIFWGGYNADDLRGQAEALEKYDRAICAAYHRKTGISETALMHMMTDTTYMTGREAVEKGFCDELLDAEPVKIAASADGRSLFINGQKMHLCPGMFAPDTIPTVEPEKETQTQTQPLAQPEAQPEAQQAQKVTTEAPAQPTEDNTSNQPDTTGEGGTMTLEELRANHPELVEQIEFAAASAAVKAERDRLRGIDDVAALFDDDLVNEARYGETACDAKELSFRAAQAAAKQGKDFLKNLADDAKASNTGKVGGAPAPQDGPKNTAEEAMAAGAADARAFCNSKKEGK